MSDIDKVKEWKWRIYKAGLTQIKFCERFGLSESQLSEWINETKTPKAHNVEKVEGYLKELGV